MTIKLRDYQKQGVKDVRVAFRTHRRVCYVLPTGGGKTLFVIHIIKQHIRDGKRVLVLAHRTELITQMVDNLKQYGVEEDDIGVIRAGDARAKPDASVQVASVQTLVRRVKSRAELIVIDEAHHTPADSYRKICSWYPKAPVLGITATPERIDGKGLAGDFDALVHGPVFSVLAKGGWLMVPRVFSSTGELPRVSGIRLQNGDYSPKQLAKVANRKAIVGNIVEHWKRHAQGRRTICFAVNVAHSKRIVRMFRKADITAEHVDATTTEDQREAIIARLRSGETSVVSNCMLFCEGWNAPEVKCVILARPTKSLSLYNQQAGRIFRPYTETSGKYRGVPITPIVLDHAGNYQRLRLPYEDRVFELEQDRLRSDGLTPYRTCSECGFVCAVTETTCPECSHTFPAPSKLEEVDGRLEEVNRAAVEERLTEWKRLLATVAKIGKPRELAKRIFESRFGCQPDGANV